jgi:Ca-activated chloride channel family protein
MTTLSVALDAFHFLRPLWLLALLPLAGLWWAVRRGHSRPAPAPAGIAPHLRAALTVGGDARRRLLPIDGVALALALLAIGAAGPTWSRQPDPFAAQSAPLVIALKVTPSMEEPDIAPTRLDRAKQKIRDLLDLRGGARTALVAYAGTAHIAVPMTEDPGVMLPYLEGLGPEVMPEEGDRAAIALALATDLLAQEAGPGGVLFVADALDPADAAALSEVANRVAVLAMLPEGRADRGMDALAGVPVIQVTPDSSDVARLDRMLTAAQARAALAESDQPWQDRGPWLAWPAAFLILLWFRRGWTMRWAATAALALLLPPSQADAEGIADWFFTPDQQGRLAFERNAFGRAAELFEDPLWRGYALYRDGQYAAAIEILERVETAQAAFIQGMAHIKSRGYRDGVRAFETALTRDPRYPGAAENLAVAREIVAFVEDLQEQSDTGEDRGIGADEVVFDNEANRGAETQIEVPEEGAAAMLTAEQWMTTVDTRTGDFLRSRFALEAAQGPASSEPPAEVAE